MIASDYIRKNLPEGDPFPVASGQCVAKLDQNESPLDLPEELKKNIAEKLLSESWTRYSQPSRYVLAKDAFAESLGVDPSCCAITNGCDGAIQGVHFLSGGCDRTALCFTPTYPMLSHASWIAGTHVHKTQAGPDYQIDPEKLSGYNLILLANPNNPTGNLTPDETILKALNTKAMVFLDEAYFNFSQKTWIHRLNDFPNLCIGRSCSKAMLAGLRLGALIADRKVISAYESIVTAPYHLSHLQIILAEIYGEIIPYIKQMVERVNAEKNRLTKSLTDLGLKPYPSATNFILFKCENPGILYNELLQVGVRLRDMSKIEGLESHLRVTIGSIQENDLFLRALRAILNGRKL